MTDTPAGRIVVEVEAAGDVDLAAGLDDDFVAEDDVDVDDEGGRLL